MNRDFNIGSEQNYNENLFEMEDQKLFYSQNTLLKQSLLLMMQSLLTKSFYVVEIESDESILIKVNRSPYSLAHGPHLYQADIPINYAN